jgi:hypothetical protein
LGLDVLGHDIPRHSGLFRAHIIKHRHPALASGRPLHTTRKRSLACFPQGYSIQRATRQGVLSLSWSIACGASCGG